MSKDLRPQIIDYFRERMSQHSHVDKWHDASSDDYYIYQIERIGKLSPVKVLLTDAYEFSRAEFLALPNAIVRQIQYILVAKPEAGYSQEVFEIAIARGIGVGKLTDFMGALTKEDVSKHRSRT